MHKNSLRLWRMRLNGR